MTPYFSRGEISLYCGDVRELLPALKPEPFDLAMADPPYGETSLEWDRWPRGWVATVAAALKPSGTMWCFGSMRMLLERGGELREAGLQFVQDVVWEKQNGSGFVNDRFRRVHECACQFRLEGSRWEDVFKSPVMTMDAKKRSVSRRVSPPHMGKVRNASYSTDDAGPRLMRSVLKIANCQGYAENETQKPVGIVSPLIEYACPPGGRMLVPFVGSGTDLEIAFLRGIAAVGFETRESQCEVAVKRISALLDLRPAKAVG